MNILQKVGKTMNCTFPKTSRRSIPDSHQQESCQTSEGQGGRLLICVAFTQNVCRNANRKRMRYMLCHFSF